METIHELPVIDIKTLTRASSDQLAERMIEAILEGEMNPLEFATKKKLITDALDLVLKNEGIKNLTVGEVEKYGKEGATFMGAKIILKELPKYDYSKDPKWVEIKSRLEPLEKELKDQEEKVKIACKTNCALINEDGEVLAQVVPAPSTTSIAVSFSKSKN